MIDTIQPNISNCTKLSDWMDIINGLTKEISYMQTVWKTEVKVSDTDTTKTKQSYKFSEQFPVNGKYNVFFSGILLNEEDYIIDGDTITFPNNFLLMNVGYPIEIHYIGNTKIKNVSLYEGV